MCAKVGYETIEDCKRALAIAKRIKKWNVNGYYWCKECCKLVLTSSRCIKQ